MRIIDSHCHLGVSKLSGWTVTEADLLETMDAHAIDLALVMPHAVTDNPISEHDRVAELCRRHPGRFRGIVNLSPLWDEAAYRREAMRCVRDHGFVALKLNTMQHLTSPVMANADKVFAVADDLSVPVIVHTGLGVPWALPALCMPQARRHPDLPIILAHAGYGVYTAEAAIVAEECPNVYLEPSWCPVQEVRSLIRHLGAERILFGSDHPDNVPVELTKYRTACGSGTEQLAACLGRTAERVFQLN